MSKQVIQCVYPLKTARNRFFLGHTPIMAEMRSPHHMLYTAAERQILYERLAANSVLSARLHKLEIFCGQLQQIEDCCAVFSPGSSVGVASVEIGR